MQFIGDNRLITLGQLADLMPNCDIETVDGGDHIINTWVNNAGERLMSIQGTGEKLTLINIGV